MADICDEPGCAHCGNPPSCSNCEYLRKKLTAAIEREKTLTERAERAEKSSDTTVRFASEVLKKLTGYSLEELNEAGGLKTGELLEVRIERDRLRADLDAAREALRQAWDLVERLIEKGHKPGCADLAVITGDCGCLSVGDRILRDEVTAILLAARALQRGEENVGDMSGTPK